MQCHGRLVRIGFTDVADWTSSPMLPAELCVRLTDVIFSQQLISTCCLRMSMEGALVEFYRL